MSSSARVPVGLLRPGGTPPLPTTQPWWGRLGVRLLALVVAAAILPTLTLGLLVIRSARVSLEREVLTRNREVARWGVEKVESFVGNVLENMRLLIKIADLDRLDPREVHSALSLFLSFPSDVTEVTLLDAQGRERVRLSEGTMYTSRDLGSQSGSPALEAARTGEEYIGPVTTSLHGEPFITLALPIQNLSEGRVAGVLVAKLDLKGLWEQVLSFHVGKSRYLYLVDRDGRLIAHPDFSLVLAGKEMQGFSAVRRFLRGGEDVTPVALEGYPNYQQREVLGVFSRSPKLGWGVIVEQPVVEALASVQQTKVETTVMLLNTVLVALLLGALGARYVTRPVRELAAGAAALGAGDFSHTIPVRGQDELAEVAATFNWMTANLRQSFQGLRTRQARLEALLEVSRELSRIQPVDSLLERIAEACGHLLDSDMVGIRVVEGDELVVRATWGSGKDLVPTTRLKIGESLTGIVAATGESLLVRDPSHDPRLLPAHREAYRRLGVQAFLGVPVKVGDRLEGVLTVRTRRPEGYSAEDLAVATAFASQAATALENARLYQQAQQAYEELKQTQDQLTQAQKMEAVGRLAGGIAHDFNNLLTVVMGRTQLMLRRLQAENPLRRDLDLINTTVERAAALTQQLLAFSRKQVLQPKVLDLNTVVADIDPMLRRLIGEDIQLFTALDPALGRVKADPAHLEQVILNLAVNSRDAMPQGGRLTIETANVELDATYVRRHPEVNPGPYIMLAVSDTGCGMDAETQARIFEPFFTTKGPGKGTGLGLSTVYGIVKQSGGNIWVYSELGRGTTFKIYLPQVEERLEHEVVQPLAVVTRLPKVSEAVLLVEDENEVRELVRDILQEHGYTVLEARDGIEAMHISGRHAGPIHLLLTDVVMPQISGRALADQLVPRRPEMKVLYMSGYSENAIVHHGVLDHGTAYLQKPFTAEALVQQVCEVLEKAPRTREENREPSQEFGIEVTQSNQATIVAPTGALDLASAAQIKGVVEALLDEGKTKLVVDLAGITYLDSAGLGALVRGMKRARELGGDLRICSLTEKALRILELTRLSQHMAVYPERETAVASWG